MKPNDYVIRFKTGNLIRVAKEIGDNLVLDAVYEVGGKKYYFAKDDLQYIVPVVGEEGIIEPKSPKEVKADKDRKENKEIDRIYGIEEKAMS